MNSYRSVNKKDGSHSSSEDEHDEIPELRTNNNNDNSSYASSSSLESNTPALRRKFIAVCN